MGEKMVNIEFLSSMSHEVRTLLNTIVGLSEDIGGYETLPEEIREDSEDLITASKKLLGLMEKIIDFSIIESNNMEIVNVPYNPREIFEELAKINELNIEDKPIELHTNIASELPYELIGDKEHMEEVVDNFLNNAIRCTDGGDIWFDVKCTNTDNECNITISVKDTGNGLTPEEMDKLFVEIDNPNLEKNIDAGGTDLGLAIAKKLIDMMGGELNVESKYGEGSTFTFTVTQKISLLEEPELSKTQRLRLDLINYDEEGYGYKKVLIVDDNELNIKVLRRILEQSDLIIEECYNGEECLDMVTESNDYDCIFMDIMMPVMSGEETLKKLKEIDGFDTPVIALTADAFEGAEQKYESEGFVDYIAKPFSKTQIEKKLDMVFKEKDLQDEDKEEESFLEVDSYDEEDVW